MYCHCASIAGGRRRRTSRICRLSSIANTGMHRHVDAIRGEHPALIVRVTQTNCGIDEIDARRFKRLNGRRFADAVTVVAVEPPCRSTSHRSRDPGVGLRPFVSLTPKPCSWIARPRQLRPAETRACVPDPRTPDDRAAREHLVVHSLQLFADPCQARQLLRLLALFFKDRVPARRGRRGDGTMHCSENSPGGETPPAYRASVRSGRFSRTTPGFLRFLNAKSGLAKPFAARQPFEVLDRQLVRRPSIDSGRSMRMARRSEPHETTHTALTSPFGIGLTTPLAFAGRFQVSRFIGQLVRHASIHSALRP